MTAKQTIEAGKAILGIEFGSTRIKAVLIDQDNKPIAQGSHEWENQLVDGLFTHQSIRNLKGCIFSAKKNASDLWSNLMKATENWQNATLISLS